MQGLIGKEINGMKAECSWSEQWGSVCRAQGQGQPSPGLVGRCPGHHADAVDDRAHAETQGAARAAGSDRGQVRGGVKLDGLQAGIHSSEGKGLGLLSFQGLPSLRCSARRHWGAILHCSYSNCSAGRELKTPLQTLQLERWAKLHLCKSSLVKKEEFPPWYLNSQRVFLLDVKEIFPMIAVCT